MPVRPPDAATPVSTNLADQHPEKLGELMAAWDEEASDNFVLPIDDRSVIELRQTRCGGLVRLRVIPDPEAVPG